MNELFDRYLIVLIFYTLFFQAITSRVLWLSNIKYREFPSSPVHLSECKFSTNDKKRRAEMRKEWIKTKTRWICLLIMINNQQYIYVQKADIRARAMFVLRFIAYFTPKFLINFFSKFDVSPNCFLKIARKKRRVYLYQLHFHAL